MKILVISNSIMAETISAIINGLGHDAIYSSHDDALFIFASENPSHIIICECDGETEGKKTFIDIKKSSVSETIVICCGFSQVNDPNYLLLPCQLSELNEKLRI